MRSLTEASAYDIADAHVAPVIASALNEDAMIPVRPYVYVDQAPPTHAAFDAPLSPSLSDEVSYVAGVDEVGNAVATTYWNWQSNSPPTYSGDGAHKWGNATSGTTGGTIKYYFNAASNWTATEKAVFVAALTLWSDEVNIHFTETTDSSQAQLTFDRGSDQSAYESDAQSLTAGGVGSNQLNTITSAHISIDTSVAGFGPIDGSFTNFGGYPIETIVHELGHALGLGHGGAYNGSVVPSSDQYSAYDMRLWTLMSYIDLHDTDAKYSASYPLKGSEWGISPVSTDGFQYYNDPTTPMPIDILAAQRLYGAATSGGLSGGQVFGFNCNISDASHIFFDFTINTTAVVTLWDGGTGNTLDLSGYTLASTISLVPGTFSSANGKINNIGIAFGTQIDNAIGGGGNDTITGNSSNNSLAGGSGADTFIFQAQNFNSGDTVNGGTGSDIDRLSFSTAGTIGTSAFTHVSHIERIVLANGSNSLSLTDALVGSCDNASHILLVNGNAGNDIINGSSVATVANRLTIYAGAGSDSLTGGAGSDTFVFTAIDLTSGDTVNGGAGASTDALNFTTAGTIGASAFAYVSHIEKLVLANGSNSLTVTDALVGSSDITSHALLVYGNAGDDIINGSAVATVANRLNIYAGTGSDNVTGGAGSDTFFFTAIDLTSGDTVNGGAGVSVDTLYFSTAGTIGTSALAHVSHIERITLANGSNSLSLTDALVGSCDNTSHIFLAYGNSGNDVIDGSAVTTVANRVNMYAGTGSDTLTGGAGSDTFVFTAIDLTSADTINGGNGASTDALNFTTAGTIGASAFAHVSHIEKIILSNGTNSLTLTDAVVGSSDSSHILTVYGNAGHDVIDASAVTTVGNGVTVIGGGGSDTMTASAGNDRFVYSGAADSTGTGFDTLAGFDFAHDHFDIPGGGGTINGIDGAVTHGALNFATFDSDLRTATPGLGAHHAMLFTADAGLYAGHTFLIVDLNGVAGYDTGVDLVIAISNPIGTLTAGDFI